MLNEILASFVVGSGVILGAFLSLIAKDEIKPGIKYFNLMKNVIFAITVLAASYFYMTINAVIASLLLILMVIISIKRFQPFLMYFAFAILYLLSIQKPEAYLLISSLIFIAGLPIGTLIETKRKQRWIDIFAPYFLFVLITDISVLFI